MGDRAPCAVVCLSYPDGGWQPIRFPLKPRIEGTLVTTFGGGGAARLPLFSFFLLLIVLSSCLRALMDDDAMDTTEVVHMAKAIELTTEEVVAFKGFLADLSKKTEVQTPALKPAQTGLYQGEPLVDKVRIGGVRATKSGKGVMVNFNGTKHNYFRFVPTKFKARLAYDVAYPVTEHISEASGNLSHAIWLSAVGSGKVAVCCKAKKAK